ncbi:Src homology-3 domain [Penicillium digitatum]|uniref:Src homology-3 domain n=1 Tax=Penicillium digitatum TaxID=36651 RepID=A0A7T6XGZ3_PENDI|nr:Src homology-3 domain [Penicillium digitatum]
MTRPQMVRADTLDLQDEDNPSAKDHTKQSEHPDPLGSGRPASHQELSTRHAEQDSQAEIKGGSDKNHKNRGDKEVYRETDDEEDDEDENHYDHEDGDLADGESDDMMDDDMMDKISSSPSIDDEDIDFEFVYALHNFVATVDGQANAAKGDTMVLLDDSNSYWWLVRVVKDGSIGYLPAEHIETPTERLARLNKHRNVDLSATMLGDNNEKSKNPLKKAMRRRNAKTVNFGAPTYIEASDVEYSTDEDSEHGDFFNDDETLDGEDEDGQEQAEDIVVEPLRPKSGRENLTEYANANGSERRNLQRSGSDRRPSSEELFEAEEPTVSRSRNGTVRNTDSFFNDDTAEPKKISLTPNLLRDNRDENGTNTLAEWKEPRGSFESIEKGSNPQDKFKDKEDKRRKEKKPGMLSGLFKRRKSKDDTEDPERSSVELTSRTSPSPKTSMDSISSKSVSPEQQRPSKPQKHSINKLHKQPPGILKVDPVLDPTMAEFSGGNEAINQSQGSKSIRQVPLQEERESSYEDCEIVLQSPISQSSASKDPFASPLDSKDPLESPVDRPSSEAQWREPNDAGCIGSTSVTSPPQKFVPTLVARDESESPVNISPVEAYSPVSARDSTNNVSPQEVRSLSPPSSPSSPGQGVNYCKGSTAAPASVDTLSVDTPTWSDSSLRSYMDEENDIRDLFIIVHDKSNVPPAGPDHPITGRLFKEESKRLKEMNNQLDGMLVNWMSQRANSSTSTRGIQSPPV